jgi:hypothetical protein
MLTFMKTPGKHVKESLFIKYIMFLSGKAACAFFYLRYTIVKPCSEGDPGVYPDFCPASPQYSNPVFAA